MSIEDLIIELRIVQKLQELGESMDKQEINKGAEESVTEKPVTVADRPEQKQRDRNKGVDEWLEGHLDLIRKMIIDEAKKIAKANGRDGTIEPVDISEAAKFYAPGHKIIEQAYLPERPFWSRIADSISGITLISGLLAIGFGLIGFFGSQNPQGWVDIAKIFAGAVVGSTGAAVASTMSRSRS